MDTLGHGCPAVSADDCDVLLADTSDLLEEVFRLRYQVYCVERGFEEGRGGKEVDQFDEAARHVLLRHRESGEAIGTVRIIPSLANGLEGLPMARICGIDLLTYLPSRTTGEVSRFAVSKQRRLSCRAGAMVRLGLMQGTLRLSCELGLTHWCAVMEPTLIRLLGASGIHFSPLGPLVEHHGLRQPASLKIASVLDRTRVEQPEAWESVTIHGTLWHHLVPSALAA